MDGIRGFQPGDSAETPWLLWRIAKVCGPTSVGTRANFPKLLLALTWMFYIVANLFCKTNHYFIRD
jgi:hypothetical protein